jgi:hypothetical protein
MPPRLFQSDHDLDIVGDLSYEVGLNELAHAAEAEAKAAGKSEEEIKRIYYDINGQMCSDIPAVRAHLDSGVLAKLIKEKEAKMLGKEGAFSFQDPCYVYILLDACAMTLGCNLPDSYVSMLKKVYKEGCLMPDAVQQMKKAFFGPDGYQNGIPYNFNSRDLLETANSLSAADAKPDAFGFVGLNVPSPGDLFGGGMGGSGTSSVIEEMREMKEKPNACGGCGVEKRGDGKPLQVCARCKERRYCSTECQTKHWKVHKKVCEPATVASGGGYCPVMAQGEEARTAHLVLRLLSCRGHS